MDSERMNPGEFQCTREFLGMTIDQLAAMLDVDPRTLRSWESGAFRIPETARVKLAAIEAATSNAVEKAAGRDVVEVHRGAGENLTGIEATFGERWWRHVAYRARQANPNLVIRLADEA